MDQAKRLKKLVEDLSLDNLRYACGRRRYWPRDGVGSTTSSQTPQITGTGSYPLEWTSNGPGSNLEGGATRGGRSPSSNPNSAIGFSV